MAVPVKADIVYYRTQSDFELEFNLNGCCTSMRLLQSKPKTTQEFLKAMRLAVSRSQIILTVGKLSGDDNIIEKVCNAIGYEAEERDLTVFGFSGNVSLPAGSIPLVSDDGLFAGCVIECGPQSIVVLTEERELRKTVMHTLVHQYVRDFSGNRRVKRVPVSDGTEPKKALTEEPDDTPDIEIESTYVIKEKPKPSENISAPTVKEEQKSRKKHPLLTVFFVLLFLAAGLAGYVFLAEPYVIDNAYGEYAALYGESGDYYEPEILDSFGELYDKNNDTVGFLKVNGAGIALPVVTDADRGEGYYETHLFGGQYYRYGTPYTQRRPEADAFTRNHIIYGNSAYGGLFFAPLEEISTLAGYRSAPTFEYDTLYSEGTYKIFASFTCSREAGAAFLLDSFENDEQFGEYLSGVLARSFIKTTVDVNPTDRIVTLVVHGKELDTFIFARLIRVGESELVDTQNAEAGSFSPTVSKVPKNEVSLASVRWTSPVSPKLYGATGEQYLAPLALPVPNATEPTSSENPSDTASAEPAPSVDYENEILTVINAETDARVSGTTLDIVSQMVEAQMGDGFEAEALKAQAVACYSYIQYNLANGLETPAVTLKIATSRTRDAVREVLGKRVYYGDAPALTYYHRLSAGYTADSATLWGIELPYLTATDSSFDRNGDKYLRRISFSAENVRAWILESTGTDLGTASDRNGWFNVEYDSTGVYALSVRLGGENYCARFLRDTVFTVERVGEEGVLPSTAFTVTYRPSTDSFVFECLGDGHGVGMSVSGANVLAQNGFDFEAILKYYYKDTVIR